MCDLSVPDGLYFRNRKRFSGDTYKVQAGQYGNCEERKMEGENDRVFNESGGTVDVDNCII